MKRINKIAKNIIKKRGNKQEIKKNIIRLMNELTNLLMELDEDKENVSKINEIKDMKNDVDNMDIDKLEDKVEDIKENIEIDNSEERDINEIVEDIIDFSKDKEEIPDIFKYGLTEQDVLDEYVKSLKDFFNCSMYPKQDAYELIEEYPTLSGYITNMINDGFLIDEIFLDELDNLVKNNTTNFEKIVKNYHNEYNISFKDIARKIKENVNYTSFEHTSIPVYIDFYNECKEMIE